MTEYVAPIMRVADANAAVTWYERLGFVKEWEHRFRPGLPLYVGHRPRKHPDTPLGAHR
jgi:hypothetical protein